MKTIIWTMYFSLCIYSFVDYHSTVTLISLGAKEMNPIVNYIVNLNGNWVNALCFKFETFAIAFGILFYYLHMREDNSELK
ncbi:MAG: DUF5658 family protein [Candidatus Thorarchaeota archaeon]